MDINKIKVRPSSCLSFKLSFFSQQEIVSILEQQSMLFVETADTLAKMSRETLVNAR